MQTLDDLVAAPAITDVDRLPALARRVVVDQEQIDGMLCSARAEIARLVLERTRLQHDLDDLDDLAAGPPSVDLSASRELLRSSLEQRLQVRRDELAEALRLARAEAAATVADAQAGARALLTEAGNALVEVLLPRLEPVEESSAGDGEVEEPGATVDVVSDEVSLLEVPPPPTRADPVRAPADVPAVAPPGSAPSAVSAAVAKPLWSRYLYADVVLPLIAVIVVVVLLLAWVG